MILLSCEYRSNVMIYSFLTSKVLLVGPFRDLVEEGS